MKRSPASQRKICIQIFFGTALLLAGLLRTASGQTNTGSAWSAQRSGTTSNLNGIYFTFPT